MRNKKPPGRKEGGPHLQRREYDERPSDHEPDIRLHGLLVLLAVVPVLVVHALLGVRERVVEVAAALGVTEDLVGRSYALELRRGVRALVLVRVHFEGELSVGLLYLGVRRLLRDLQNVVAVLVAAVHRRRGAARQRQQRQEPELKAHFVFAGSHPAARKGRSLERGRGDADCLVG